MDELKQTENSQLGHQDHQPSGKRYPLRLWAHDISSPSNVGSLFRLADALGIEGLLLSGSATVPPNRKLRLASRAAEKYVPYEAHATADSVIELLRANGYRIVALEISAQSFDLRQLTLAEDEKICLLLGNEVTGIADDLLALCDDTVHIPMQGNNSSMNVSMAAGIACFELLRERLASR